jgi:hypothetical protein
LLLPGHRKPQVANRLDKMSHGAPQKNLRP